MIFKVSDNQCGQPHPSDSWDSCFLFVLVFLFDVIVENG